MLAGQGIQGNVSSFNGIIVQNNSWDENIAHRAIMIRNPLLFQVIVMDITSTPIELLRDAQVKTYFLNLLDLSMSSEEKYQKFIEFCSQHSDHLPQEAGAGGAPDKFNLEAMLPDLSGAVTRVAGRMRRSQHKDGGWGPQLEQSNFWHTGFAVLFLKTVQEHPEIIVPTDLSSILTRGMGYLEAHPESWAVDTLSNVAGMSVYEIALTIRVFYRAARSNWRRESALRIYRSIDRLAHSQNADGGWDANLWGYEIHTPVRVWSEVGATSAALQALAATREERFQSTLEKAMRWLANTQNPEGSWNAGSCHPVLPDFQLAGQPDLNKTCDGLQGLLAGQALGIPMQPYQNSLDRAVDWLRRQEKPVLDRQHQVSGWGWGHTTADYEMTGMILETLLRIPQTPLPLLAANAQWLIQTQRRQADDAEDGSWVMGHTARIGLALILFYRCVKAAGSAPGNGLPPESTWAP